MCKYKVKTVSKIRTNKANMCNDKRQNATQNTANEDVKEHKTERYKRQTARQKTCFDKHKSMPYERSRILKSAQRGLEQPIKDMKNVYHQTYSAARSGHMQFVIMSQQQIIYLHFHTTTKKESNKPQTSGQADIRHTRDAKTRKKGPTVKVRPCHHKKKNQQRFALYHPKSLLYRI